MTLAPLLPLPDSGFVEALHSSITDERLRRIAALSPYLARLIEQDVEASLRCLEATGTVETDWNQSLDDVRRTDVGEIAARLRLAKRRAHRLCALRDLAALWDWQQVCPLLSGFADLAVRRSMTAAIAQSASLMRLSRSSDGGELIVPGLFALAMGKQGAHELNYSSDIDLILLLDEERLPDHDGEHAKLMARFVRAFTQTLSAVTPEGYVFRLDLRLRPDPGSTAAVVPTGAALRYYEAQGRTWERAAHIKARCVAGDALAAEDYLLQLRPFIWRRSLDFYALEDLDAMQQRVQDHRAANALHAGFDVKRGRGGIRAIEIYVQALQLIYGGRDPDLRAAPTIQALDALTRAVRVSEEERAVLSAAYHFWRQLEHRLQMVDDAQTHLLPDRADQRHVIACLMGEASLAAFDAAVAWHRDRVEEVVARRFDRSGDGAGGSALNALVERFAAPGAVRQQIEDWARADNAVTRSTRAQTALRALLPQLLAGCLDHADPQRVFTRFATFLDTTTKRAAVLSLLQAQPAALAPLLQVMAMSPGLTQDITAQPAALDVLVDPTMPPVPRGGALSARLNGELASARDFEQALNAARRVKREVYFHLGVQALLGRAPPIELGRGRARLADRIIAALLPAVLERTAEVTGHDIPGAFVVVALGKHGGAELGPRSDLDLLFVTVPDAGSGSYQSFFLKAAQRLIAALSVPTEEGPLFDIDMNLRPQGKSGPLATSLSFLTRYYEQDAWTWEFMALTRARIVAGNSAGRRAVGTALLETARRRFDRDMLYEDAANMRARMREARPGRGLWDVKHDDGGFVDIEFAVQCLLLENPVTGRQRWPTTLRNQIRALLRYGALNEADAATLEEAIALLFSVREIADLMGLERGETLSEEGQLLLARQFDVSPDRFADHLATIKSRAREVSARILRGAPA